MQAIAVALAIGLSAIGAGIAIGMGAAQAHAAIARNPETEPVITRNFTMGVVFGESVAIFGLVIAMLILFHQFS